MSRLLVVDPEEFKRIGRISETMVALWKRGDNDSALVIWDGLTEREQRMIVTGIAMQLNQLRFERGDPPDATYGPPETHGL